MAAADHLTPPDSSSYHIASLQAGLSCLLVTWLPFALLRMLGKSSQAPFAFNSHATPTKKTSLCRDKDLKRRDDDRYRNIET
jgi:hypothetical protein